MKKVWIAGAGSGIGEALLKEFANDKNVFCVGVSRRGKNWTSSLENGVNYKLDLCTETQIIQFLQNYFESQSLDAVYITLG
ncbi:MAG: 3-oxoacyl-ACP reductase, partial [Leptospiraceae bacterium]|nr:3-oxoacyl-ACP reductase [Leptospiraceae bacterium]